MPANFISLDTPEKLALLVEQSHHRPVVLFKHSNTCGISAGVHRIVNEMDADINIVVVQKNRDISNLIAQTTGIRHESPQAIVLKGGNAVYHASHYDIEPEKIADLLISGSAGASAAVL